MQLLNPRHLIAAALVASSFVVASRAFAQEGDEPRPARSAVSTFRYESNDNGRAVSLEVTNGKVVRAEVAGERIPVDRVRRTKTGWEMLAADGTLLARVEGGAVVSPPMPARAGEGRMQGQMQGAGPNWQPRDGGRGMEREVRVRVNPQSVVPPTVVEGMPLPKAMIGAGLGKVDEALAAHLGIDAAKATMLTTVLEGLPAQKAGLQRFDVLVSVNGSADASPDAIRAAMKDLSPGAKVKLGFRRGSKDETVELEVAAFDAEKIASIERELGATMPEGFSTEEMEIEVIEPDMQGPGMRPNGRSRMFFIGPDGARREFTLPAMPAMPNMPEWREMMDPARIERFEQAMRDMERRMQEWGERLERRWNDRGERAMPQGPGPDGMREGRGADRPGMREEPREGAPSDERIRRLEEQMERLMRELEKANARDKKPASDA